MQCPRCQVADTKVVDSRQADDGAAVRRRRECQVCSSRFTTFERVEEAALALRKRSGEWEPFEANKIVDGVQAACKGRPVTLAAILALSGQVEDDLRATPGTLTTQQVGLVVLERLRQLDHVAYLRFASVYKGFDNAADFARELALLEPQSSATA